MARLRLLVFCCLAICDQAHGRRATNVHGFQSDHKAVNVCTKKVVDRVCKSMGAGGQAFVSIEELADSLSVQPVEAESLLAAIDLMPGGDPIDCQQFCEAAVAAAGTLLDETVPAMGDTACFDKQCEEAFDVSESSIQQGNLVSIGDMGSRLDASDSAEVGVETPHQSGTTYQSHPSELLRLALNIHFNIFPAPDEEDTDADVAVIEQGESLLQAGQEKPSFGDQIEEKKHKILRRATLKAAAWTADAIRKINGRPEVIKKWLMVSDKEVKTSTKATKKKLTDMVAALGQIHFQKGESRHCSRGTFAYVYLPYKKGDHYIINICDHFWEVSDDERISTLVHEASHHFGTIDVTGKDGKKAYGEEKCLKLDPSQAKSNADTYMFVVKALATAQQAAFTDEKSRLERIEQLKVQLADLVGLDQVKDAMKNLLDLVAISKIREERGLSGFSGQSLHMRFLGNPGTGKTVVARIVGELLLAMKAITPKEGDSTGFMFREASRADLVAEYKGQTAIKVQKLVQESLGGVLFIDEAYALVQGPSDSFGVEAVDTLIKEMEDNRAHIIVILAGYEKEMDDFFNSNPGFRSRVPFSFDFADYTCPQLVGIGRLQLKSKGLALTDESTCEEGSACWWLRRSARLTTNCCDADDKSACPEQMEDRTNGNGRSVRNILESSYRQMALRVLKGTPPEKLTAFEEAISSSSSAPELAGCSTGTPEVEIGSYSGPDLRCKFSLLDAGDLLRTTTQALNLNIAPCKNTVQDHHVDQLAASEDAWTSLGAAVSKITLARSSGKSALAKACRSIQKVFRDHAIDVNVKISGGPKMRRMSSEPLSLGTHGMETDEDAELPGTPELETDDMTQAPETTTTIGMRRLMRAKTEIRSNGFDSPAGFHALSQPGMCKDGSYLQMRGPAKRLSLEACAAACQSQKDCTSFSFKHSPVDTCYIHQGRKVPKYGSGRASVRCYVRDLASSPAKSSGIKPSSTPSRSHLHLHTGLELPPETLTSVKSPRPHPGRHEGMANHIGNYAGNNEAEEVIEQVAVQGTNEKVDALMAKLNNLVGLSKVKAGMGELRAMVDFDQWRKKLLPDAKSLMGQSFHMQFLGNPGTGKTVVARIVGELLVEMGVIANEADEDDEPVFEEVARADLVAEYKGQTAPKVMSAVERALGGVLFIDEAYSLKKEGKDSFGQEAVDTLIKEIEDKRDNVIAIFAGYEKEMETFFDSNPGFKSRVPFKFYFDDYTCSELHRMSGIFMKDKDFEASSSADLWIDRTIRFTTGCCDTADCQSRRDNGNGRTVRNILEATYRNFAARVVPGIYTSPELRPVLDRLDDFIRLKAEKKLEYERNFGTFKRTYEKLEADFGMQRACSGSEGPPGSSKTWSDLCTQTRSMLKVLDGEDIALVAASKTVDMLLSSCRAAKRDLNELDSLASSAMLSMSSEEWDEVVDDITDQDCEATFTALQAVQNPPPRPSYDTLGLMQDSEELRPVLAKLQKLVGLDTVKEAMGKLFGLVKLSTWRTNLGMSSLSGQSFHMRFLGNPGTGKTVVARIVGEMLVKMNVVSMPAETRKKLEEEVKNKTKEEGKELERGAKIEIPLVFRESSRADLVASYSGQTAPKVEKAVEDALGGVLFLDEAYALVRDGKDNFGQEAVDTLIKEMEDKRKNVIVILAGYEAEMDSFFDSNPGFKSRVPFTFRFEDYSCRELGSIAKLVLTFQGINASVTVQPSLDNLIAFASGCCENVADSDCFPSRDNGNGRTVRNVIEALSRAMASRIIKSAGGAAAAISREMLETLDKKDVETVAEEQAAIRLEGPCGSDGLVQQLKTASKKSGGLIDWFGMYKLSHPDRQLHRLVRETGRMTKSLTSFQSPFLKQLNARCSTGLEELVQELQSKIQATCGEALEKRANEIDPSSQLTMKEFQKIVHSVDRDVREAKLLQRLLGAEDLPMPLDVMEEDIYLCQQALDNIRSKSLLAPLEATISALRSDE